eukprot:TRINITY_DN1609_c0_g1_i1.p1 TRINITY_DN1609_c0_g1~~TRINITY_DN1609_c0_g1_i1.p1  ORF type:complete len:241 (-),score=85.45 TRINITY_DN1609_c0_g1_i1:28-750(-)
MNIIDNNVDNENEDDLISSNDEEDNSSSSHDEEIKDEKNENIENIDLDLNYGTKKDQVGDKDYQDPNKGPGINFQMRFAQIMNEKVNQQGSKVILSGAPQIERNLEKHKFEGAVDKEVKKQKKEFKMRNYVIPDAHTDVAFEKMVKRIATRGVVKLFNLVQTHKQSINVSEKKKKPGNSKLENLSKRKFLELLKNTVNKEDNDTDSKKKISKSDGRGENKWEILDDDYMMKKKTKKRFSS